MYHLLYYFSAFTNSFFVSLKELIQKNTVTNVTLSVIEVFGNNTNKIQIFDLFDERNKNIKWKYKKGSTSFTFHFIQITKKKKTFFV